MAENNNGGPAFPTYKHLSGSDEGGITMRDYFAIRAPEYNDRWFGNYCRSVGFSSDAAARSAWNYEYADAMLAARNAT